MLLSRSAVVSLAQIWFDMWEPALKHLLYFQYNAEEASAGRRHRQKQGDEVNSCVASDFRLNVIFEPGEEFSAADYRVGDEPPCSSDGLGMTRQWPLHKPYKASANTFSTLASSDWWTT